jgi:hypothetical protein
MRSTSFIDTKTSIHKYHFFAYVEKLSIDEEEFKSLFQIKEEEIKKHKQTTTKKDISTVNAVKVIDPKRANNGGIILARLKMTYDDIARAINEL